MAKIYARKIHDGSMTLDQVPARWVEATKAAYKEMYGHDIDE